MCGLHLAFARPSIWLISVARGEYHRWQAATLRRQCMARPFTDATGEQLPWIAMAAARPAGPARSSRRWLGRNVLNRASVSAERRPVEGAAQSQESRLPGLLLTSVR